MREYGKIAPQFWTGKTGKTIRTSGPYTQVVALYLLTSPSSTMLGLYYLPLPTLCHEVGCSLQAARKAIHALSQADFAHYDEPTEYVWVPNMARFQLGKSMKPSDKRISYVLKAVEVFRGTPFFNDFLTRYQQDFHLDGLSPIEVPSKALDGPSEARSRSRSRIRSSSRRAETGERDMPPEVDLKFEEFWNLFPKRNGKRLGKPEALRKYLSLSTEDRQLVIVAVRHYAGSELILKGIGIMDPHRFLQKGKGDQPWREWIEPEAQVVAPQKKCAWNINGDTCEECIMPESKYCTKHKTDILAIQGKHGLSANCVQ